MLLHMPHRDADIALSLELLKCLAAARARAARAQLQRRQQLQRV